MNRYIKKTLIKSYAEYEVWHYDTYDESPECEGSYSPESYPLIIISYEDTYVGWEFEFVYPSDFSLSA